MKLGMLAASLVLVAGAAAGCGGDDGDSGGASDGGGGDSAASVEDFCGAFQDFYDDLTSVTGEEEDLGKILKDAADQIEDAGVPEDIPADAEAGLQVVLDQIDELPDDASAEDIAGLNSELSEEDQANSQAFTTYLNETCPEIGGGDSGTDDGSGTSSEPADPSESAETESGS